MERNDAERELFNTILSRFENNKYSWKREKRKNFRCLTVDYVWRIQLKHGDTLSYGERCEEELEGVHLAYLDKKAFHHFAKTITQMLLYRKTMKDFVAVTRVAKS